MSREISTYEFLLSARLAFCGGMGLYGKHDYEITDRWISELGIGHLSGRKYVFLSDGEKQLVSIARAFLYETPVILLDEPTSSLDVPNKKMITDMLHRYAVSENKLILYTSHDFFIAEKYCNRAWYISHDRQFFSGDFLQLSTVIRKDFGID